MKKLLILCVLCMSTSLGYAQSVYDSATRYRLSSPSYSVAMDTLMRGLKLIPQTTFFQMLAQRIWKWQ